MIYDMFKEVAAANPGKVALVEGTTSLTYAGLLREAEHAIRSCPKSEFAVATMSSDILSVINLLISSAHRSGMFPVPLGIAAHQANEIGEWLLRVSESPEALPNPYLLLRTSGTTGDPKVICLTQETKVLRVAQFTKMYEVAPSDVILVGTPLYTSMAQRLVLTALLNGATARLLPNYSPSLWLAEARQCSIVVGVPQQLRHLEGKTGRMRMVLSSSAPRLEGYEVVDLLDAAGVQYRECYGTSEVAIATEGEVIANSLDVGKEASGAKVCIAPDGEILVRSVLAHSGYYGRADLTAESLTVDGWFRTGDSGFFEGDKLHLEGRLSERILVGGTTVWPADVEHVVRQIPHVTDCAATAEKDETFGEVVKINIQSDEPLTLRDIQRFCQDRLTDAQIPRSFAVVANIPRTELGKVQRRKL